MSTTERHGDGAPAKVDLPSLLIRARRPTDADDLAVLLNLPGYRFGTNRLPFHSPEEVRGWIEKTPPGSLELVAMLDGRLVGNAGLARFAGRRSHVAELGMGVHDNWTGRGIGAAMLAALLDSADKWLGLLRLQLTVYVDNEPALHLYRRFGFELEGRTGPLRSETGTMSMLSAWHA